MECFRDLQVVCRLRRALPSDPLETRCKGTVGFTFLSEDNRGDWPVCGLTPHACYQPCNHTPLSEIGGNSSSRRSIATELKLALVLLWVCATMSVVVPCLGPAKCQPYIVLAVTAVGTHRKHRSRMKSSGQDSNSPRALAAIFDSIRLVPICDR